MAFLDELSRKIRAQIPAWMGGQQSYPEGYAESRLSHGPMQVIPNDQWGEFKASHGIPGQSLGATVQPGMGKPDTIYVPQREFTGRFTGDLPAPSGLPPGSIPRHEAIHQFLGQTDSKLDTSKIESMVGTPAMQALYGRGYNYTDSMREIPARLTTEPQSLGMSEGSGQDAMRKYIELLRQTDRSKADRLSKYLGLSGSEKGDGVAELQRPNDTF